MNNLDWKILTVLYEQKSISKAADALFISQSALTKRIQSIEAEWKVKLLHRSPQGISFTEEGKYLVGRAAVMLDFLKEIEDHFAEHGETKEVLRFGVPNMFARLYMPSLFQKYADRYHRLNIQTTVNSSDMLIRQLMDGTLDICVICGDYPYLGEKTCLFTESLHVVLPKGKRLDDIQSMPVIRSYLNPGVRILLDQWWKGYFGSRLHETYTVPDADIAIEMAEHGMGVTFVFGTDWKMNETTLQMIPVFDQSGKPVTRSVWLMVSEKCFRSPDIMDFVSLIEEHYNAN